MNEKELYQQKRQAQLDQWKAEADKPKAKASGASADTQLESNRQIEALEGRIEEGRTKLAEVAEASEDSWESIKEGAESAWKSMGDAFSDAAAKFRNELLSDNRSRWTVRCVVTASASGRKAAEACPTPYRPSRKAYRGRWISGRLRHQRAAPPSLSWCPPPRDVVGERVDGGDLDQDGRRAFRS